MSNLFIRWVAHSWMAICLAWFIGALGIYETDPELAQTCVYLACGSLAGAFLVWRAQSE